jgi:death-on-curing protein
MVLLAPTAFAINAIHDVFMQQYGCSGYMCQGMVEGCMERAMTYVYSFQPFPRLFSKAGAILYSFITFHPFVDGNKRTAFETTRIFLRYNGYQLIAPKDGVDFTRAIADQRITDVHQIAQWLRKYSRRNVIYMIESFVMKRVLQGYLNTPKERRYLFGEASSVIAQVATFYPE